LFSAKFGRIILAEKSFGRNILAEKILAEKYFGLIFLVLFFYLL